MIQALVPLGATAGIVAICAPHAQMDASLTRTLIALAEQGERIAVIVADNHFEADEIARSVDGAHLKVARGETPHQVRTLVRRLHATRAVYSVAVVVGLLEPFYDEQVKWTVGQHLLTDIFHLLNELARTLRVLVVITPPANLTRPYLKDHLLNTVDFYTELPALVSPTSSLQDRLF